MGEYIAQKEVPDLIIDGMLLDTIDEFDLFSKNGNTEINISIVVIPKSLKDKINEGCLVNTMVTIKETVRTYDGDDIVVENSFIIKDYEFSYALTANGEPTHYNLILRNYNNG